MALRKVGTCEVVEYVRVAMTEAHRPRVKYVIGPDGSPLTIADLPAPGTKRWVIRRKAEVVAAVRVAALCLARLLAAVLTSPLNFGAPQAPKKR